MFESSDPSWSFEFYTMQTYQSNHDILANYVLNFKITSLFEVEGLSD